MIRNILEKTRNCDYDEVKAGAQAIYQAEKPSSGRSRVSSLPRPLLSRDATWNGNPAPYLHAQLDGTVKVFVLAAT